MERSILYNITPIGVGTPFVESLTSYITRLAAAHCVFTGDLIFMVYAPLLEKEYLSKISKRGGNGFFDSAIGINGQGKLASEFSELTNKFTGRYDLSSTTLQKWSEILPSRGLLKKTKSWCPFCYDEAKTKNEIIYDQLIWSFQTVNHCIKHRTPLIDLCERCNKTIPIIDRKSTPGYCSRCGEWLGTNSLSIKENKAEINEFLYEISLIGELLSTYNLKLSNCSLTKSVNFYVNEFFGSSPIKAAQHFNIPKTTFRMWVAGESRPNIIYLIRMCKTLGISIVEFLEKKEPKKYLPILSEGSVSSSKKYDHKEIKKYLNHVIETKEPLSISDLARIIGCDRKLLTRKHKEECDQIKNNYNASLLTKKQERNYLKIEQLNNAFNILANQGIYPSRRKLEDRIGSGFLKEEVLQEKWKGLKEELYK